MVSANRKLT